MTGIVNLFWVKNINGFQGEKQNSFNIYECTSNSKSYNSYT